jgi:cytochrome c biogenesis protein
MAIKKGGSVSGLPFLLLCCRQHIFRETFPSMSSSPSTTGIRKNPSSPDRRNVELISSMRFAIALLAMIAIAAVIGTVMKQGEATNNYINQFGPFWFEVFRKLGLYAVYSAWWFLLLMGVLVTSTTLCIMRNAPKMLRDMRSWRENVREIRC